MTQIDLRRYKIRQVYGIVEELNYDGWGGDEETVINKSMYVTGAARRTILEYLKALLAAGQIVKEGKLYFTLQAKKVFDEHKFNDKLAAEKLKLGELTTEEEINKFLKETEEQVIEVNQGEIENGESKPRPETG